MAGVARLSDATAESLFISNINGPSGVLVSIGGKAKSKRCVLRRFLKVTTVRWLNGHIAEVVPKRRFARVKWPCAFLE